MSKNKKNRYKKKNNQKNQGNKNQNQSQKQNQNQNQKQNQNRSQNQNKRGQNNNVDSSQILKQELDIVDFDTKENLDLKEDLNTKKDFEKKEPVIESAKETDIKEESEETPKKAKNKILKFVGRFFAFVGVTLLMIIVGLYVVMWICTKGPSTQIRELFVLSVRESSAGGFLADIYLTPEEIAIIEEKNKVEEVTDVTDTSIVQIAVKPDSASDTQQDTAEVVGNIAESSFDVNVYTENGIEFHEIAGATFTGIAMVVADPSRVFIGTPRDTYDGGPGISVPSIADRYGAIAATNGGFFVDTGGHGDGGTPIGVVFSKGKMVYGSGDGYYNVMGFNEEGVLICGSMTGNQAINMGIRDALSCNPFLIINGEGVNVGGKGGGLNPRTALGQRADGAVVLLTIDGRQASSLGASMSDMVDVMLSFDVVNAGNLDGGGSTVLYYNGEIKNVVMSIYGARGVPNAVCVSPE